MEQRWDSNKETPRANEENEWNAHQLDPYLLQARRHGAQAVHSEVESVFFFVLPRVLQQTTEHFQVELSDMNQDQC